MDREPKRVRKRVSAALLRTDALLLKAQILCTDIKASFTYIHAGCELQDQVLILMLQLPGCLVQQVKQHSELEMVCTWSVSV